jgi:hypothetical protein
MSIVYFFNFPCNIHLNEGTEEEARYDRRCKLVPRQHELVPVEGGGGGRGRSKVQREQARWAAAGRRTYTKRTIFFITSDISRYHYYHNSTKRFKTWVLGSTP